MTDYTPNTEDVRQAWECQLLEGVASDEAKADADWDTDRMAAQFDRWLDRRDREMKAAGLREWAAFQSKQLSHSTSDEHDEEEADRWMTAARYYAELIDPADV